MKPLRTLIIIAFLANLITLLLYNYAANQPGGSGVALVFTIVWMPVLWLISINATIIVSIINRKTLFQNRIAAWTYVSLLFTTPIPAMSFYFMTHPTPETRCDGMETNTINGGIYKTELWEKTATHNRFAEKYFVADSAQKAIYGDKAYKKDSIWVYFDNNGDTLRLEFYKNDRLISTKQLKKE